MTAESDSSLATRPSLLARLKHWSEQTAWRDFDADYSPLLRNVARKAGLTDVEADEVVQESLIAVAKKIGDFKHAGNRGSFRAWLFQQARWRIADRFRERGRARGLPAAGDRFPPDGDPTPAGIQRSEEDHTAEAGPGFLQDSDALAVAGANPPFERLWNEEWEAHIRQRALERLRRRVSARQFQLFDLHVLQGLSVRDAARAAGSTMAAVYMAKSRVGRLLRNEVSRLTVEDGIRR